jgi:aurora kinase
MCAIKRIPKKVIREENILDQLIREIKIQSCLDHQNITKLYGFFDDNQYLYLVL